MHLRHTAALALVGWYLMVPPPYPHPFVKGSDFDIDAPISKWSIYSGHDSAKECEAAQSQALQRVAQVPRVAEQLELSQCVETDDPRLKSSYYQKLWIDDGMKKAAYPSA
jgi:hypothetical protein